MKYFENFLGIPGMFNGPITSFTKTGHGAYMFVLFVLHGWFCPRNNLWRSCNSVLYIVLYWYYSQIWIPAQTGKVIWWPMSNQQNPLSYFGSLCGSCGFATDTSNTMYFWAYVVCRATLLSTGIISLLSWCSALEFVCIFYFPYSLCLLGREPGA